MADEKISDLPVATAVGASDVLPIVQSGTTKQAAASLLPGSFISANIARVDPSGDDSTGIVGDLSKPFLTAQAAIDAIEAGSFNNPIINIGGAGPDEELTTALTWLAFQGEGNYAAPFSTLTFTEATANIFLTLFQVEIGAVVASTSNGLTVEARQSQTADITNSAGAVHLQGDAISSGGGVVSAPGNTISVTGINAVFMEIDSAGSAITLSDTILQLLTAAASVTLVNARILTNNAGVTPIYQDTLLNPALMDFSTLPTSEPTRVGAAWIDTMNSNVVKVKL